MAAGLPPPAVEPPVLRGGPPEQSNVSVADRLAQLTTVSRGFEALLDDGPLPIVVRFDREGYSTLIKRFSTLHDAPRFDISMEPLKPVHCPSLGSPSRGR